MAISHCVCRWQKLELVIKLLQPVSDAIHQLEADAPMLSPVTKVYATLLDHHVPAWVAALPGKQRALGEGVLDAFKARVDKHLPHSSLVAGPAALQRRRAPPPPPTL